MPRLFPIRAVRYAADGDISGKIAPPYDVLDEEPKRQLLARDPHNIVAVDLPVTPPKTVGPDAAYEAAGRLLEQWLATGVLKREEATALFAYEQAFSVQGSRRVRRGLFANIGLEDFNRPGGGVFRHEHTLRSGTDDRLKLMQATRCQLSPVFGVYDDAQGAVSGLLARVFKRPPEVSGTTLQDGVEHRLWAIRDEKSIGRIRELFESVNVYIADGHHRYTTALNYHRQVPDNPAAAGCLFVLVALQDAGLEVLPTHRVLSGLQGFSMEGLIRQLRADGRFITRKTPHGRDHLSELASELPRFGPHAVGMYDPAAGQTHVVWTLELDPLAAAMPDRPKVWRTLDVAVFHELLVDRVIRPAFGGDAITYKYPHELADLAKLSHEAPNRLGVIMQPTPLRSVCEVSLANGVMPPKSTFFYPKVATGLVIHRLSD